MKSIYITGNDMELINVLPNKIQSAFSKDLEVVGQEEFNPDVLTNCSYSQPDFLLTDFISKDDAIIFFDSCPQSNIILLNSDSNRANSLISELNKEGYYNITALNKDTTRPSDLCNLLIEFEENLNPNPTPKQSVVEEQPVQVSKPTEDTNTKPAEKQEEGTISLDSLNNMMEAETPEVIEQRKKEIEELSERNKMEKSLDSQRENIGEVNFNQMNFSNPTSKVISVFSKRGGTGVSTVVKEMGNIFSNITLPKKLANNSKKLSVCMLDLDFECGNLKTYLGLTNLVPNTYMWINDILDKIENGENVENIYFPKMSVLSNYTMQIGPYLRCCPTDQGDMPVRIISRICSIDSTGTLLPKIIKCMIKALRKSFDIVLIDCGGGYNDVTATALENSDEIVYTLLPSIADVESFKVFNDEIKNDSKIAPQKIKLVLNQYTKKIKYVQDINDTLKLITYENFNLDNSRKEIIPYKLNLKLPFTTNAFNFNNNSIGTTFYITTNGSTVEKQAFLNLASALMPMLKIKSNVQTLDAYKRKEEQKKLEAKKKAETEKLMKDGKGKGADSKDTKTAVATENKEPQAQKPTIPFNEYMASDLSKITYENFIKDLTSYEQVKKINKGFPYLDAKPKNINKKIWATYQKNLKKEVKEAMKKKSK